MARILPLLLQFVFCTAIPAKPTITLDEFFDYTYYPTVTLSPSGHYLIVQTRRALWNSSAYNNSLWLYEIRTNKKTLISDKLSNGMKPQWSPTGNFVAFLLKKSTQSEMQQHIHVFCVKTQQLISIPIGTQIPLVATWGGDDSSLYLVMNGINLTEANEDYGFTEWKDVIQYRKAKPSDGSTIYQLVFDRIDQKVNTTMNFVKILPFQIDALLFSSSAQKLILTSVKDIPIDMGDFEIYSIDLRNNSSLSRLTTNQGLEENLKLSTDGKCILFTMVGLGPDHNKSVITQTALYALDLATGKTQRLAKDFQGSITEYNFRPDGGIYILGQWGTNVQIYTQQSPNRYTVLHRAWEGTYASISSSLDSTNNVIAFVFSSYDRPREVYIVNDIKQLINAKVITNENQLFTERNLPRAKIYQWTSDEDDRTIEGILHYPPGQYESKNLPLLVLIHGGPYLASTNHFTPSGGSWAPVAATEGWLVLEPNYRGSSGYGDEFLNEIRYHPLSRPGRDILSGVNHLIKEGTADRNRLAVGGYSYGGFLTNWLITQTTQFNAALPGAGSVDQASVWGTMDVSLLISYLWGGFPWNSSKAYVEQSPIYHVDKVRTPTLIVTGENDKRVPPGQSLILERALRHLNVPVQLLIFPKEGHLMGNNPWHQKILVREQMKWVKKYGHTTFVRT